MNTFDATFFNELSKLDALVKLNESGSALMSPSDGFRLRGSELHAVDMISKGFMKLMHNFVDTLTRRSAGRYLFEKDFRVRPWQVYSYSQGRSGRKQLYVGLDAITQTPISFVRPWGVSIGLGFDFRDESGIVTECVNEYEGFYEKVCNNPELFDATFGSLGGYAEPSEDFRTPVTAKQVGLAIPDVFQPWVLFGRRVTLDDITKRSSLEDFVDECIRVFDVINNAGY